MKNLLHRHVRKEHQYERQVDGSVQGQIANVLRLM